jgi:hypothetical protein
MVAFVMGLREALLALLDSSPMFACNEVCDQDVNRIRGGRSDISYTHEHRLPRRLQC